MPQERIFFSTYDVVASPADDTETVIAVLEGVVQRYANTNIALSGWAQLEPNADASKFILQVRRGDINGDTVGDGGVLQFDAGTLTLTPLSVENQDAETGQVIDATYVLTLTCVDATADTSVGLVKLEARVH